MFGLPYREIWAADTEFTPVPAARVSPICFCARELITGRAVQLWHDQLRRPPFSMGPDTLYVAFSAGAEFSFHIAAGWPLPQRVLDLHAEFRNETNGQLTIERKRVRASLLNALAWHGIPQLTSDAEKDRMHQVCIRGAPFTETEKADLLRYCLEDADSLIPLLEAMLPQIRARGGGNIGQALIRGRAVTAAARIEDTGIPVDTAALKVLDENINDFVLEMTEDVNRDIPVFDGYHFRAGRLRAFCADHGIRDWILTDAGKLSTTEQAFKVMAERYPVVEPLRQLMVTRRQLRDFGSRGLGLPVGADGRNRYDSIPFGGLMGRFTPKASECILLRPSWLRHLVQPPEGRSLIYADYEHQEIYIAAVRSGDDQLLEAAQTGDPYIRAGQMIGTIPPGADADSHPDERAIAKRALLGVNYGMSPFGLSARTGIDRIRADLVIRRIRLAFPAYADFARRAAHDIQLAGTVSSWFGWHMSTRYAPPRRLLNFPCQANGSEMTRLAACLAVERGLMVCATLHDALLVECAASELAGTIAAVTSAMEEASAIVLGGVTARVGAELITWPARWANKKGQRTWQLVTDRFGIV